MKFYSKMVVITVSLLLSAGVGFAAEAKKPVSETKALAESANAGIKVPATVTKQDAKIVGADAKALVKAKIVDINSATEAELKEVPGIGAAYAAKIIAGRPYANKAQLKSRNVLPTKVYEQVKELIIAKQPKK